MSKTSHSVMNKLFESKQENADLVTQMEYKTRFEKNPNDDFIKNKYIELNYKCGIFYFEKKEYAQAHKFLTIADDLASDNHHLKGSLSTQLLMVEENIILSTNPANKQ